MCDMLPDDHGPCWICGADATDRCDYGYNTGHTCNRRLCFDHAVVEAQHWDKRGWDGVDIRCQEHRNLFLNTRDMIRGSRLPPAPRWEGDWICSHDTGHMWEESSPHPVLTRFMRLQKEL